MNYFARHDPQQIERAEKNPKHKMALVFRSYLGQSSNWANAGDPLRKIDYQIWCGPAIGAFNQWVIGISFTIYTQNCIDLTKDYGKLVYRSGLWFMH